MTHIQTDAKEEQSRAVTSSVGSSHLTTLVMTTMKLRNPSCQIVFLGKKMMFPGTVLLLNQIDIKKRKYQNE